MPEERRVALDLLDVRESIEEMGDQIRWIPTDHMLVDCMTKLMPPDAMLDYLKKIDPQRYLAIIGRLEIRK